MPLVQRFLNLLGLRIGYRESGPADGRTLVMVHGWAASSRIWLETVEQLQSRYRCLALDLPGHGLSENPPIEWHTVERYVELCRCFLDQLSLSRPVLMGHSMRGLVALEVAMLDRTRCRGLILASPAVRVASRAPVDLPRWLRSPILGLTRSLRPLGQRLISVLPSAWFPGTNGAADRAKRDLRDLTPESALGSLSSLLNHKSSGDVSRLNQPALIIGGRRDRLVSAREAAALAARMPNARVAILDAGHHPFHESREAFAELIGSFLDSLEGD